MKKDSKKCVNDKGWVSAIKSSPMFCSTACLLIILVTLTLIFLLPEWKRSPHQATETVAAALRSAEFPNQPDTAGYEATSDSSEQMLQLEEMPELTKELFLAVAEELKRDEIKALKLLAAYQPGEHHFYDFVTLLTDHFKEQDSVLSSIEKLEILRSSQSSLLFEVTASELLQSHAYLDDPAALLKFITAAENSGIADRAVPSMGAQLTKGKSNPQEVLSMIDKQLEVKNKESLYYHALDIWLFEAPEAAMDFMDKTPHRPSYDQAAYNLVTRFRHIDPAAVMTWAEGIQNKNIRAAAIYDAAQSLARENPTEFHKWLGTVEDPSLREAILNGI